MINSQPWCQEEEVGKEAGAGSYINRLLRRINNQSNNNNDNNYIDRLLRRVNNQVGLGKRSVSDENEKLREDVALIGLLYIKLFNDNRDTLARNEETLNRLSDLHNSVKKLGSIPEKVSRVLRNKMLTLLK